ncbi:MAG: ElyC/SanA/YdcF family protein [Spirochaetota bacterium]
MKYIFRVLAFLFSSAIILSIIIDLSFTFNYSFIQASRTLQNLPQATVAIVPGAAVYGKKPSPVLLERLEGALQLYEKAKVKKILLSGDNGTTSYNEIRPMLNFMLQHKVEKKDIFVDFAGFRTLDTLYRAKKLYEIEDAIIVTQSLHQPRAAYIADKLGIKIAALESNKSTNKPKLKNRFREFLARNLAWIDMNLFHTIPKYLGEEKYPISGSGNQTWGDTPTPKSR